jgi:hypothetical protein
MTTAWIITIISGSVSLAVAVLAHLFTKRRDHESDWRKLKLEIYKEFILALSGIVAVGRGKEAQRRYADAVNSFVLIAPREVLDALYAFQDEISYRNERRSDHTYEELLNDLIRAMRLDSHPKNPHDSSDLVFRTLDIPPSLKDQ